MQASSTVSPREEGQPRQCMPMDRKMGAVWGGAMSRMSPMTVSFFDLDHQSFLHFSEIQQRYYTLVLEFFQEKI